MDEDMGILFDIIDTLLAEREFDSTDDEKEDPDATNPFAEDEDDEEAEVPGQQNEDGDDEDDEENPVPEDENADEDDDEDDDKGTIPAVDPDNIKPRGGMNADSVDAIVRQRIQLGMVGRALNMDGLENMSIKAAKKAVVKCVRPSMNLDGKSSAFINAAYGMAVDEVNSRMKKDTRYQKRQMFNGDSRSYFSRNDDSSMRHRERMMERQKNHKKEDK
jgi:hypothetical protein